MLRVTNREVAWSVSVWGGQGHEVIIVIARDLAELTKTPSYKLSLTNTFL